MNYMSNKSHRMLQKQLSLKQLVVEQNGYNFSTSYEHPCLSEYFQIKISRSHLGNFFGMTLLNTYINNNATKWLLSQVLNYLTYL